MRLVSYMNEEWKDIPGFDGFYQVSNTGLVRRHSYGYRNDAGVTHYTLPGLQRVKLDRDNYLYIKIGKKLKLYIHKLVAQAFLPKKRKGQVVTHLDGNRSNNHASNLKYVSKSKAWKLSQKRKSRSTHIELSEESYAP